MRNFSTIALMAISLGLAGVGQIGAASAQGMGDPSAMMRANLARCQAQLRGEYPRYHNACLPGYQLPEELRVPEVRR
jgi:hypothetical protein